MPNPDSPGLPADCPDLSGTEIRHFRSDGLDSSPLGLSVCPRRRFRTIGYDLAEGARRILRQNDRERLSAPAGESGDDKDPFLPSQRITRDEKCSRRLRRRTARFPHSCHQSRSALDISSSADAARFCRLRRLQSQRARRSPAPEDAL